MTGAGGTFELAPILNPDHSSRIAQERVCPVCGRSFRPWSGSQGFFCTRRCTGRARSLGIRGVPEREPQRHNPFNLGTPEEELQKFLERWEANDLTERTVLVHEGVTWEPFALGNSPWHRLRPEQPR